MLFYVIIIQISIFIYKFNLNLIEYLFQFNKEKCRKIVDLKMKNK